MEKANDCNNIRKVFRIVNQFSKKAKPPPQNLTEDSQGNILESAGQAAEIWRKFLEKKFDATDDDRTRPSIDIPCERSPTSPLTRREFDATIQKMSVNKTAGPDSVPVEAIKYCSHVREALYQIITNIWD